MQHTWWSRFYEYAWAKKFASEDHVVLDAAAGIPHMFKWFLAGKCQEIWAVDIDKRILDLPAIFTETSLDLGEKSLNALLDVPNIYNNINFVHGSITDLPKEDMPLFDRIFLVSVLEHMHIDDIVKALSEMKQVLKKNGLIVVTMDYPDRNPEDLVRAAAKSGLVPLGSVDYKVPTDSDALHNRQLDLKIFRLVLAHKSFLTTKDL